MSSEAAIEDLFMRMVRARNGWAPKSEHVTGLDRIYFTDDGRVFNIELKAPNGELDPRQVEIILRLNTRGHIVHVLPTKLQVEAFFRDFVDSGEESARTHG